MIVIRPRLLFVLSSPSPNPTHPRPLLHPDLFLPLYYSAIPFCFCAATFKEAAMAMSSLLSSYVFSPHRFKHNGISSSNFIFTLSNQALKKSRSTKSSKPFTVQSKGTDSADAPDRLISAICYFYPFFDGIQYGKYVITQFSPIGTLIQPLVPAIKVFKSFPFNGFLVFLTLYFVVVRNQNFSRY